jgi:hypothetical protein
MEYNIKTKAADGKFVTIANFKRNQYGNLQIGVKATPELRALLKAIAAEDGSWHNLSVFEEDGDRPQRGGQSQPESGRQMVDRVSNMGMPDDDSIPF